MSALDYERAWLRLKAEVVSKTSHGQRDLLVAIAKIEVECAIEDDRHDPGRPVPILADRRAASGGAARPIQPING